MSKTEFSIRTSTSSRRTKLKQKTDVVITLVPSPSDGDSVMSDFIPIPWKILTFHANSDTYHPISIHSKLAVCTVKEKENGVLTPLISEILMKGTKSILQFREEEGLQWSSTPPPYTKQEDIHESNACLPTEQQAEPTKTQPTPDNFVIKNEYADTRLALCLVVDRGDDDDDARLPIVDLGRVPKNGELTISGQLCAQAYAVSDQIVGKPLNSKNGALFSGPVAVTGLSQNAFVLYTQKNGLASLE